MLVESKMGGQVVLSVVICIITSDLISAQDPVHALICENSGQLTLTCPRQMILPQSAFFGRGDYNTTCPHATAVGPDSCSADTALDIVRGFCQGKERCDLEARVEYFGDPCPGAYKYLSVSYTCVDCENVHPDDVQCEFWRAYGQCTSDAEWMGENCRKSCLQCNQELPACENPHGNDLECAEWAARGECILNPAWMIVYCHKACLRCDSLTECGVDRYNVDYPNADVGCSEWYDYGECTASHSYMLRDCRKSCFQCNDDDVIRCANKAGDELCTQWADDNQCASNPGYMFPFCYKACSGCTEDPVCENVLDDVECATRVANSECETDPETMYNMCWKACVRCDGPATCENRHNNDVDCDDWAKLGECQTNSPYMLRNCTLSCTKCGLSVVQRTECENQWPSDEDCDLWAEAGECSRNPSWMIPYCRQSCTLCNLPATAILGKDPVPGQVNSFTRMKTLLMPESFPEAGRLTHFVVFLANNQTVSLEVWRQRSARNYELITSKVVRAQTVNTVQTVLLDTCVYVQAGDRLGFTNPENEPAPIPTIFDLDNVYKVTHHRGATSRGRFSQIRYPYRFSLSAGYDPGNLCPDS